MRSRVTLLVSFFIAVSLALPLAAHASIPFFGPIIPEAINRCAAGWGAVMDVINRIIELLITLVLVLVAPVMIAYAGFLYVVNPFNPGGIAKAKSILTNTIIGIIVALAAWLIVDAVMAALTSGANGSTFARNWTALINWGDSSNYCLLQTGALQNLNQADLNSPQITGVNANGTFSTILSTSPGNPCNPATISSAAQSAGYTISANQAKMLACVAQGESTCGAKNPPYNLNYSWGKATANGKASTAAGAYQVLLSSNSSCYDNSVCEKAGGTPGVPLNCKSGFDSNGFPISGSSIVTKCQQAAGNVQCSAAAAACLLNSGQSFSSAYATDPYTASCQSQYGG